MKRLLFAALFLAWPVMAHALDKETKDFVAANMIAVLYHEFGHALIDILKLPIYGQEEDAADVLSAVLINRFFDDKTALRISEATAVGFLGDQSIDQAKRSEVDYWDVHGPDLQRYFTFVCLIYGANPDERVSFARNKKLPPERRETCEEEYELAERAWGQVIDDLKVNGGGRSIRLLSDHRVSSAGKLTSDVMAKEIKALNADLLLPKSLLVRVEPCDTVNAFYDGKTREIIMCTEFADYIADVMPR